MAAGVVTSEHGAQAVFSQAKTAVKKIHRQICGAGNIWWFISGVEPPAAAVENISEKKTITIPFPAGRALTAQYFRRPFFIQTGVLTIPGSKPKDAESTATWLLLTFNRVHYGGEAPVQLLLNAKDMRVSVSLRRLSTPHPASACHATKGPRLPPEH
ncbi:unnamed protein product [Pleuronectes platessa]|uniref:Uncharacterized protein n=1 Tax=Pleuronectes platessa TaxID=8262 RepID=A0A9N7Y7S5_PLEPL|nr:unnamed protein product [Pleuronectes platessa]